MYLKTTPKNAHFYHLQRYTFARKSKRSFVIFFSKSFVGIEIHRKKGLFGFHLQPLRAVAIDKLFPFMFAPIGNGKPIDSEERSFLLILDNTDFAVLFRKLSPV